MPRECAMRANGVGKPSERHKKSLTTRRKSSEPARQEKPPTSGSDKRQPRPSAPPRKLDKSASKPPPRPSEKPNDRQQSTCTAHGLAKAVPNGGVVATVQHIANSISAAPSSNAIDLLDLPMLLNR